MLNRDYGFYHSPLPMFTVQPKIQSVCDDGISHQEKGSDQGKHL